MGLNSINLNSTAPDSSPDPYRALAAAIVWRAVQDAFCGNKFRPNLGMCMGQHGCEECRWEAYKWLRSEEGQDMIEAAGLDPRAVLDKVTERLAAGEVIYLRSKGVKWVPDPRREEKD